jgi:hypothetical protein
MHFDPSKIYSNHPSYIYHRVTEDKSHARILLEKCIHKIAHLFSKIKPHKKNVASNPSSIRITSPISKKPLNNIEMLEDLINESKISNLSELEALHNDIQKDLTMLKIDQFIQAKNDLKEYQNQLEELETTLSKKINQLTEEKKIYIALSKDILKYCKTCNRVLESQLIMKLNSGEFQHIDHNILSFLVESQLNENQIALDRLAYIFATSLEDLEAQQEILEEIFKKIQPNFAVWDLIRYCSGSKVDKTSMVDGLKHLKNKNQTFYDQLMRDIQYNVYLDTLNATQLPEIRKMVEK